MKSIVIYSDKDSKAELTEMVNVGIQQVNQFLKLWQASPLPDLQTKEQVQIIVFQPREVIGQHVADHYGLPIKPEMVFQIIDNQQFTDLLTEANTIDHRAATAAFSNCEFRSMQLILDKGLFDSQLAQYDVVAQTEKELITFEAIQSIARAAQRYESTGGYLPLLLKYSLSDLFRFSDGKIEVNHQNFRKLAR